MRRLCGHAQPQSLATQSCSLPGLRLRGLILPVLIDAAVDPAAAGGGSIVLQIGEAGHGFAVGESVAIDLFEHRFGARLLVFTVGRIIPGEIENGPVFRLGGARVQFLQPLAQMKDEMEFAARIAGRIDRFVVPLQQALRIGETAVFFRVRGGRKEEDFGRDIFGATSPRSCSGETFQNSAVSIIGQIAHHAPFQVAQTLTLQGRIG